MKKSTIVRTILLAIVIINLILKAFGKSPINIDETTLGTAIDTILSIAIILVSWWKNNSFTKNAQQCDAILTALKTIEDDEDEEIEDAEEVD